MRAIRSIYLVLSAMLFRRDNFYCKLYLSKKLQARIWERPGEWCSEEQLEVILMDLRKIAKEGQQGKEIPAYGVLSGDKEDLKNRIITIIYERGTNKQVGFAAQTYFDIRTVLGNFRMVHLGLVYVIPEYQNKSISRILGVLPCLFLLMKNGFKPIWLSNVSQVPAVIGVVASHYTNVFPDPIKGNKQASIHRLLAAGIMKDYRKSFGVAEDAKYDAQRQIIFDAYTGGSDNLRKDWNACPKYRDEKVNLFCAEQLDYKRGDDFLQIGVLSPSVVHTFLKHKMSSISKIHLIAYLGTTALLTPLLPKIRLRAKKTNQNGN